MLKIRLMRIGAKKRPFYRVVAVDERNKRTGAYIELLGTYNPLTTPHEVKLKQDKIDEWVKKGAQMSDGFLRIIGKAPQRPARKPKKSQSAEAPRDRAVDSGQKEEKSEEVVEDAVSEEQIKSDTSENQQTSESEDNQSLPSDQDQSSDTPTETDIPISSDLSENNEETAK